MRVDGKMRSSLSMENLIFHQEHLRRSMTTLIEHSAEERRKSQEKLTMQEKLSASSQASQKRRPSGDESDNMTQRRIAQHKSGKDSTKEKQFSKNSSVGGDKGDSAFRRVANPYLDNVESAYSDQRLSKLERKQVQNHNIAHNERSNYSS